MGACLAPSPGAGHGPGWRAMSPVAWDVAIGLDLALLVGSAVWRVFAGDCVYDRSRARALSQGLVAVAVAGLIVLTVIHGVSGS